MFWQFLGEFLAVFALGFLGIFVSFSGKAYGGLLGGIYQMFNIPQYIAVVKKYKEFFGVGEWIGLAVVILVLLAVLGAIIWLIIHFSIRIYKRFFSKRDNENDLVDEVNRLRRQVIRDNKEKNRLIDLCLTNGAKAHEVDGILSDIDEEENAKKKGNVKVEIEKDKVVSGASRFYKLTEVDKFYKANPPHFDFDDTITLEEFCDRFRNWACSEMKLFYEKRVIRLFFSAFATTRILILQGISGTGKTSLPYAVGQWLNNPATIASVQPSWRDRTEIFGYFNEFTKRFNETQILKVMYEARWTDQIYITVIDEANIARVEYYFAEMLSILEMPSHENWIVDICAAGWDTDPIYIEKGRFKLPENMWFVCTINNDDSTFAVSDKVYDRAIPISLNSKGVPFEVPEEERNPDHMIVSYKHLEKLFKEAQEKYKVSEENIRKFNEMDDYVIQHFRLAFGNRIVKQLREFVPVYVACGGTEIDGLDYVLCNKILRKFESLNLAYIRDEVDAYISYLNDHFGYENMTESKEYLERLKKFM